MQNTAIYAPITYQKIVIAMIKGKIVFQKLQNIWY